MFSSSSISRWALHLLGLLGVLLVGIDHGRAQSAESQAEPKNNDPFVTYHTSLTKTADKVLAATAQRSIEAPRTDSSLPAVMTDASTIQANGLAGAISRVQQLRPTIEPILREERVPTELAAIVMVESGGQLNALSPKGARGIWQFMPDTARRYGLIVTPERDERLDIQRSTRAAARYLRDLHRQFGDWQLTFAAYNAGEDLVQRAIERNGTRDFSKLSSKRSIPLETRKYVPAVVDATKMFSNPNSPMASVRNVRPLWRVFADAGPGPKGEMERERYEWHADK